MSEEAKNKGGCPPRYKTVKEIEDKINAYFESCKGQYITDDEGNILTDKNGNAAMTPPRPLTITGLALALGFTTRQSLLNYQAKDEFMDTINKAKSIIEQYAEERLYDRDGVNGAKFNLSNNFTGWREKQSIEADLNVKKLEDLI